MQVAVVFKAQKVVEAAVADQTLNIQVDGTFRVVPRLFHQLLVVFAETNGVIIPAFLALTTSRSQQLYRALLADVAAQFLRPVDHFLADWEAALQVAAQTIWPEAHATGCWFHFAQAVLRKVWCGSSHCLQYYTLFTLFVLEQHML